MKVTAPVVSPLSSASWPAVSGPRRPIRSRQRMSVRLSFSFLARPLVEVAGRAEVPHDLGAQLLAPAPTVTIVLTRK